MIKIIWLSLPHVIPTVDSVLKEYSIIHCMLFTPSARISWSSNQSMRLAPLCIPSLIVYCLYLLTDSSKMLKQVSWSFIPWGWQFFFWGGGGQRFMLFLLIDLFFFFFFPFQNLRNMDAEFSSLTRDTPSPFSVDRRHKQPKQNNTLSLWEISVCVSRQ